MGSERIKLSGVYEQMRTDPRIVDALRQIIRTDARERETRARFVARLLLPRRLKWLVDHPRLLGWYYRVRPSKRPMMSFYR